jgi:hypothetical protein
LRFILRARKTQIVVRQRHVRATRQIVAKNRNDVFGHGDSVDRQVAVKINHHAGVEQRRAGTAEEHLRHHAQLDALNIFVILIDSKKKKKKLEKRPKMLKFTSEI